MKIIVNTASTFEGGAIQVAVSLLEECRSKKDHEYHVILGEKIADILKDKIFPSNYYFYRIGNRPARNFFALKSANSFLRKVEKLVKPDIVFTTSGPAYWRPKVPHLCGFNIAHFVYPESSFFKIIPLRKKLKWTILKLLKKFYFKRNGKFFVVQTEDINSRLRLWLKTENVFTVSNTCSSYYFNNNKGTPKLAGKFPGEFRLLIFSTFRTHKNLRIIKKVIEILPDFYKSKIRFVTTFPLKDFESFFNNECKKYIYNVGPVKIEEGPSLYKECDALFLPTLLECFSAAYAEAMAMEIPILTSDLTFARSVCRDAALYFNPLQPNDAVNKIILLLNSTQLNNQLIANGKKRLAEFGSASDRAQSYLNLCEKIIHEL